MSNFDQLPRHIAVIPDGNRRWAKKRGLPVFEGHRIGAEKTLPLLIEKAAELGVRYFTFWALSTENLKKRSRQEISALFNLMRLFLRNKIKRFRTKGIRLRFIGDLTKLPADIQKGLRKAVEATKDNDKITLILAINYGGRDEIIRAVNKFINKWGKVGQLEKEGFSHFLDTKEIPDPDLIIRTGGEKRLSGFLLWQSEYSELYFSEKLFPDFTPERLEEAVSNYTSRQRRFGR